MPITIPSQRPVSSGSTPQGVSLRDAMAPGLALGHVANGIQKVGKTVAEHDARIQQAKNAADLTEIKTKMKSTYADFQLGLEEDHDYMGYADKWEKQLESLQKGISEGKYSQAVIDAANRQFTAFQEDTRTGVVAAAQTKAVTRAKQAYANGFQMAVDAYDPANPSTADFDEHLEAQSWMTPEEKKTQNELYQERIKRKQTFAEIHEDPRGWLEDKAEQIKADPVKMDPFRRRAEDNLRGLVANEKALVLEAAARGDLDLDDIEALTPEHSEAGRMELKILVTSKMEAYAEAKLSESEKQDRDFLELLEKEDETYGKLDSTITTMYLHPLRDGDASDRRDDFTKTAKSIRESGLDPRGQAKLMDKLLRVYEKDYQHLEETEDYGGLFKRDRDLTDNERGSINKAVEAFRLGLERHGYRSDIGTVFNRVDKLINEFYTKNKEPTAQEIEAMEARVLEPIKYRFGREHYLLGESVYRNRAQVRRRRASRTR